jgi:hypothetical protein
MPQFIVCKVKEGGRVIAGTPPTVHESFDVAKAEAERLIATVPDAESFLIFKAVARSERLSMPVRTTDLY